MGRLGVALFALSLLVLQSSVAWGESTLTSNASSGAPTETARILVHFQRGATDAQHAAVAASIGGVIERELRELGVTRIAAPLERGTDPGSLVAAVSGEPGVVFAEADARVHLQFAPNDPLWTNDPYVGLGQWGPKKIFLDRAIDLAQSTQAVTVAIIDTGVDATHPDLTGVVRPGAAFVSATSPECAPFQSTGAKDDNSHGTHVAGIIAALQNNGIGISGIAANARILPIKSLDCTGTGSVSDIAEGITYAVSQGARVINISLGSSTESATLRSAVQYAISRNVLIVAAVGNCGVPPGSSAPPRCLGTANLVEYPGAYPGVLGVGATAMDDTLAAFSTQGPQVSVTGPGVRIVSTTPSYSTYQSERGATLGYGAFSGTSQATPFAAGVAAMLLGADPSLTAALLIDRLKSTADDLGVPGTDIMYGAGRLNALRAMSATVPAFAAKYDTSAVGRSMVSGTTVSAKVSLTNTGASTWVANVPGAVKLAYHWIDAKGDVVVWDGARTPLPADVLPGTSITVSANILTPTARGGYTLRFDLVRDGLAWYSQRGVSTGDVPVAIGSGLGATYAPAATSATLFTAAPAPLSVTLTNTGSRPWSASGTQQMRLSYHWLRADGTMVVWDGARAPAFASDVQPGQSVTVGLPVVAPATLGAYTLRLDLVQEEVTWFSNDGVPSRDVAYVVSSGYAAAYVPGPAFTLLPGGRSITTVGVQNTGVVAWAANGANPVHLAAHVVDSSGTVVVWDGTRTALKADVAPGTSDAYPITVDAPLAPGAYRARVDIVREGIEWFSGLGIAPADVPLTVAADYRAQLPIGPLSVSRAAPTAQIAITNITSVLWSTTGIAPVRISAHWYDAAGNVLVWDGPRTELPHDVRPGETINVTVALATPPAGATTVAIDLVSEGVRWFAAGQSRSVVLLP
ncbi:MAG: S8 family serine peptidase [Candidatus Limnocylindria bacterium]|nr:S8 family serine peptidase [Candidatus Limnocylindria bacterium]